MTKICRKQTPQLICNRNIKKIATAMESGMEFLENLNTELPYNQKTILVGI